MKIIVTGGFGFIGSCLIKKLIEESHEVLNIDIKTYASMPETLDSYNENNNLKNIKINISDFVKINKIFNKFQPDTIFHLAAESHVDNSINSSRVFIDTNIIGTYSLLEAARGYLKNKPKNKFIFIHVSTDEVYGSLLNNNQKPFKEDDKFAPNSPYSASKTSSDLLVRAWYKTYNLPTITTNCCNNFGPWQFPEKLIPLIINNCIKKKKIPIYGNGQNIREWIFVEDHVDALIKIFNKGNIGEVYNIGSGYEISNIKLTKKICNILDKITENNNSSKNLITFVNDRAGHDYRYAINSNKIKKEFNFKIKNSFDKDLKKTINWYLKNSKWLLSKNNK